jgi:hypothetical protein
MPGAALEGLRSDGGTVAGIHDGDGGVALKGVGFDGNGGGGQSEGGRTEGRIEHEGYHAAALMQAAEVNGVRGFQRGEALHTNDNSMSSIKQPKHNNFFASRINNLFNQKAPSFTQKTSLKKYNFNEKINLYKKKKRISTLYKFGVI